MGAAGRSNKHLFPPNNIEGSGFEDVGVQIMALHITINMSIHVSTGTQAFAHPSLQLQSPN